MARLIYALNQSLDGYVDHDAFGQERDLVLFRHFIDDQRAIAGSLYGRRMYEIMRYWDDDQPGWNADDRAYADAWRAAPKWVASRTLTTVGPNATLIADDLETAVRRLKAEIDGDIEVAGPVIAGELTELGLIDEYRIYLHPVVLGEGRPFFTGARPPLTLVASERIGGEVIRLSYMSG